jgi:hypothetical protein
MSSASLLSTRTSSAAPACFAGATILLMTASAVLVAWVPVEFAFITFFLLAGPHSWMEGRYYFLTRMPVRWGSLRGYFVVALTGACVLSASAIAMPWLADDSFETTSMLVTLWNAALVLWLLLLIRMRERQSPRRRWPWMVPLAGLLLLVNWATPFGFGLALVFVHPLMAVWILDRELLRRRPDWRRAYHGCLYCLPLLLGWLWLQLAHAPPVGPDDVFTFGSAECDGAEILPGISSRFVVATLAFLVMLHYCVWVVAFPLLERHRTPWQLRAIPLAWRSNGWRIGVASLLIVGAVGVVLLWPCLLADFRLTREIYLMASALSILAEAPFLLRSL